MPRFERTEPIDRWPIDAISTEILSCPFCGCMDVEGGPFPGNREETFWLINCGNPGCKCEMEAPTREEVLERWNRNRTGAVRQYAFKGYMGS